MYRFLYGEEAVQAGNLSVLRTASLFRFSDRFRESFLPYSVELGRSVVNRDAKRAILGLFVVWAGLGAMVRECPAIRYFFGNVSLYADQPTDIADLILAYLYERFPGEPGLIQAQPNLAYRSPATEEYRRDLFRDVSAREATDTLSLQLKERQSAIPPILLSYMKATEQLAAFDTARDSDFGGALECAIWVPTRHLTGKTMKRFVDSHQPGNSRALQRLMDID